MAVQLPSVVRRQGALELVAHHLAPRRPAGTQALCDQRGGGEGEGHLLNCGRWGAAVVCW